MVTTAEDLEAIAARFAAAQLGLNDRQQLRGLPPPSTDIGATATEILGNLDLRLQRLEEGARAPSYKWSAAGTTAAPNSSTAAAAPEVYAAADTYTLPLECSAFTVVFDDQYGGYFQITNHQYPNWGEIPEELVRGPKAVGYALKIERIRFRALSAHPTSGHVALYAVSATGA